MTWLPGSLRRYLAYNKYVILHKWYVAKAGWEACRYDGTLMEFWLCLLHDMNKFTLAHQIAYARHFYNPDGTKRTYRGKDGFYNDDKDDKAFDRAWLWHIQRSKHHPQYWVRINWAPCWHRDEILLSDDGGAKCLHTHCDWSGMYSELGANYYSGSVQVIIQEMPIIYITEMMCDWKGAGLAQGTPDTKAWYTARGYKLPLGPETRSLVETCLEYKSDA